MNASIIIPTKNRVLASEINPSMDTYVTVAIPTYRRKLLLMKSLESVISQYTEFQFEVYVLDNDCDNDIALLVKHIAKKFSIHIRYIPVREIGLHVCRNLAAITSTSDIIVYIDDDVIAPPTWLQALCSHFSDEMVAGIAGRVLPKFESPVPCWFSKVSPGYFSLLDFGDDDLELSFPSTPYGCNMAYRREVVLELGGFAPDSVGGGSIEWRRGDGETGFAYRCYEAGHQIVYSASGWLYHRIQADRLTRQHLISRSMKIAISKFYSQMRRNRYGSVYLLCNGLISLVKSAKNLFIHNLISRSEECQIDLLLTGYRYLFSGLYQIRLSVDPSLRNWVLSDLYFPENFEWKQS